MTKYIILNRHIFTSRLIIEEEKAKKREKNSDMHSGAGSHSGSGGGGLYRLCQAGNRESGFCDTRGQADGGVWGRRANR